MKIWAFPRDNFEVIFFHFFYFNALTSVGYKFGKKGLKSDQPAKWIFVETLP